MSAIGRQATIAWTIARRGFHGAFYRFGLYIVVFLGYATAAVMTRTYVGMTVEDGVLISANPLILPLNTAMTIAAVYVAFAAAISVAREQESGTLRVLFFGPVDPVSYVTGKYLEQLLTYALMLAVFVVLFLCLGAMTNFLFSTDLLVGALLSVPLASCVATFGILLSVLANRVRTSLVLLLAVLAGFLGVQWADSFLGGLDRSVLPPVLQYIGPMLSAAGRVTAWLSPFAYLNRGLQAAALLNARDCLAVLGASLLYSAVLLAATVIALRGKGVQAR